MTHENAQDRAPERMHIDTRDDYELRRWAREFEVSTDELRDAVMTVGNGADIVRQHLGR